MIFSSIEYILLFVGVLLFMVLVKSNKIKKFFLLLVSYFFYAYWDYRFAFLLFFISFVNYRIGISIEKSECDKLRKNWLVGAITFNLIILGFFKYFNFFIDSANILLGYLNLRLALLDIILPIGISFIVFETISYIVDIYRGNSKSAKNFWDLALLIAFFPHLIAGPILKPNHFLPQLERSIVIRWGNLELGLQMFLLGLVKKILIADRLALFVDPVFKTPQNFSSATIWLAVVAYAIQIYCDFSGYTDMAIGSAKCLGFEIPRNFNMPYISKNITEFWRRWHISLSTWLRDYLYIPLGGNRDGKVKQYMNLLIVMLLGGLWHGASWNFVTWGGLHGIALIVHKVYKEYIFKKCYTRLWPYEFASWLLTFTFVCISWVFFRSNSFSISLFIIKKMFFMIEPEGINWYATSLFTILPILIISHIIGKQLNSYPRFSLVSFKGLFILFFVLIGFFYLAPVNSAPFIYFQF